MENLIRNLKYIAQNHDLYKNLIYTRHHLYNHYNTIFKELYSYDDQDEYEDEDEYYNMLPFVQSMKKLDKHIEQTEESIQLLKGKIKYKLINILLKLKLQYREDTVILLQYWRNRFY